MTPSEWIAILDFGSQYTQLIARRIREANVFCEILAFNTKADDLALRKPRGIILSGGPASVYADKAPKCDPGIFRLGIPVLGICYGMQLGSEVLGGSVHPAKSREFGATPLRVDDPGELLDGVPAETTVWMSHGDRVEGLSDAFRVLATTPNCPFAAVRHREAPFFGVQFHPEVAHTPEGGRLLRNFLFRIAGCRGDWTPGRFIDQSVAEIREATAGKGILCALSGGVDSSVVAVLCQKAVGDRLYCVFVDNGLLRKDEAAEVERVFRGQFNIHLECIDASAKFLGELKGITEPETKRVKIGHAFIRVFEERAPAFKDIAFLAQGTLYPDVIESVSPWGGPSARIKGHHNVAGLPDVLGFKLVEPLRFLFKDEVRAIGRALGIPDKILMRQPFPGPGLGVRVIGEITAERLRVLRDADAVVTGEVERAGIQGRLWQYFAVLLPVQTVGVMGDERTYENVAAVRIVESTDGMTADWARVPPDLLARISSRIINEVKGINRVVYDISSKPPSTIEWE